METTKTINLLAGSRNAVVHDTKDNYTTIHFSNPAWPTKIGIYRIPGRWKIKSSKRNIINLVPDPDLKPFDLSVLNANI